MTKRKKICRFYVHRLCSTPSRQVTKRRRRKGLCRRPPFFAPLRICPAGPTGNPPAPPWLEPRPIKSFVPAIAEAQPPSAIVFDALFEHLLRADVYLRAVEWHGTDGWDFVSSDDRAQMSCPCNTASVFCRFTMTGMA